MRINIDPHTTNGNHPLAFPGSVQHISLCASMIVFGAVSTGNYDLHSLRRGVNGPTDCMNYWLHQSCLTSFGVTRSWA